jgi:SSS family transporter
MAGLLKSLTPVLGLAGLDYTVVVAYLLVILVIGWWFTERKTNTDSYMLGDRSMAWWLIGVSYTVSLLSTISLVAIPGEAYSYGIIMSLRSVITPVAAMVGFYLFVRFYFRSHVFTPFQYLEERFDVRVRSIAAVLYWLTRLFYLALVLYSSAKVFEGASQWPVPLTIVLVGIIGTLYTTCGGVRAVVWTDLVQFLILAGGLTWVLVAAVNKGPGGMIEMVEYAVEHGRGMPELRDPEFYSVSPYVRVSLWVLAFGVFSEFLFYNSSDQIAIQRLLSTSAYSQAKRSMYTFVVISIPVTMVLWLTGMAIFAYYGQMPEAQRPKDGDLALFRFIAHELPAPVPGLIVAAMLAAVMSTLDSGINSLSTVATKDFYLRLFRKEATEEDQVRVTRWLTIFTGAFAVVMGLTIAYVSSGLGETIMEAGSIWISLSVIVMPVFLIGVTTRSIGGTQAIILLIIGALGVIPMIIWYLLGRHLESVEPISFMYLTIPGLVAMIVVGYVMAWLSPCQPEDKTHGLTLLSLDESNPDSTAS